MGEISFGEILKLTKTGIRSGCLSEDPQSAAKAGPIGWDPVSNNIKFHPITYSRSFG